MIVSSTLSNAFAKMLHTRNSKLQVPVTLMKPPAFPIWTH